MYLGPHIVGGFDKKKRSANWLRMDQFQKSSTIFYKTSKLKGGPFFMKKLPTHVFEAPQLGPFQTNVFQSAQNGPILKFFKNLS